MNKKADAKQDAKLMKGMSPKAKSAFKAGDAKHDAKKGLTGKQDQRLDEALAKDVKKKFPVAKKKPQPKK